MMGTTLALLLPLAARAQVSPSDTQPGPLSAREIAQRSFPSVVLLVMNDAHEQPLKLGSGFVVSDEIVATNLHVIEGANGGYAKLVGKREQHEITGAVATNEAEDWALLKAAGLHAPPLPLAVDNATAIGDEVYVIGNPRGLEGTFSRGIVSGIRQGGLIQITAPISPGSSGGPVLNSRGAVIGIAAATFKGGQNLNFAIPVTVLNVELFRADRDNPMALRELTKRSGAKSILDDTGGIPEGGVVGSHFLWQGTSATFSIRNGLRQPVRRIHCLLVFRDPQGVPIHTNTVDIEGPVKPGLATRSTAWQWSVVTEDVKKLTGSVEIRVLDFELVPSASELERRGRRIVCRGWSGKTLGFDVPTAWTILAKGVFGEAKLRLPRSEGDMKYSHVTVYDLSWRNSTPDADIRDYAARFSRGGLWA